MNTITRRRISQEEIDFIRINYPTKGGRYCAEVLNRTRYAINNIANKHGIKIKEHEISNIFTTLRRKNNKDYNVDADLFINPTNPSVIYTLGLLWADGNLNKYKNSMRSICLKSTYPDGDEFYKIMSSFGKWNYYKYNLKNKHYKNLKPSIQIVTNNRPLFEYLELMGYSSKSITSADKILNTIPLNLKHYWFRGLFDGDGCLYVKGRTIQVIISGPLNQDWTYLSSLLDNLNVTYSIKKINKKKTHSSFIRFTGANNCKIFLDYIYTGANDDCIFLSRKFQKSSTILA